MLRILSYDAGLPDEEERVRRAHAVADSLREHGLQAGLPAADMEQADPAPDRLRRAAQAADVQPAARCAHHGLSATGLTEAARFPELERLAAFRSAAWEDDPVLFVYGPGTDDAFIDTGLPDYGIEAALWESLRAAGFERIGFYSLTRKLYFRDETSLRAAARPAARRAEAAHRPRRPCRRRMRPGFSGPLGDRIVRDSARPAALPRPVAGRPAARTGAAACACGRRRRAGAERPATACRCSTT